FHFVGVIFFLLGLGTLLPWNFFITAIPYFEARLTGNCSAGAAENQTALNPQPVSSCKDEFSFSNWLTLLSQLPLLLFTFLNSVLYRCISDKVRILGSLAGILFLFGAFSACWGLSRKDTAPFSSAVKEWRERLRPLPCCFPWPTFTRYYLDKRSPGDSRCELETKTGLLLPDSSKGEPLNVKNGNAVVMEKDGSACPPEIMNGGSGIWLLALSIVMDFSITLSVFPAITTRIVSSSRDPTWLGLRVFLIPLFLLCNIQRQAEWPVLFHHDAWFVAL
ncbi:putative Equilibrative nucleoside transporter 2 protein, partial [Naja naja]